MQRHCSGFWQRSSTELFLELFKHNQIKRIPVHSSWRCSFSAFWLILIALPVVSIQWFMKLFFKNLIWIKISQVFLGVMEDGSLFSVGLCHFTICFKLFLNTFNRSLVFKNYCKFSFYFSKYLMFVFKKSIHTET